MSSHVPSDQTPTSSDAISSSHPETEAQALLDQAEDLLGELNEFIDQSNV